jgi:methyl-accepting chemotaxis protein
MENALNLDNISLSKKLWGSIIMLLLAMLATGVWTRHAVSAAHRDAAERTRNAEELIKLTTYWKALSVSNTNLTLASIVSTEPAVVKRFSDRLKTAIGVSSATQKKIVELATTEEDKAAIARIGDKRTVVLAFVKKSAEMKTAGQHAEVEPLIEKEFMPALAEYEATQDALISLQQKQRDAIEREAQARIDRVVTIGTVVTLLVIAAGLVLARVLVRSIHQPLNRAVDLAEAIAAGDLTHDVHDTRRDELGRLLQGMARMSAQLRTVVAEVRQGVGSVSVASSEIASGNQDLSSRTEQTASNLQQTASSLEQLTGTVTQAADVARQASQLASSAADAASRGGNVVGDVVSSMEKISDASRRINDIIGVIDGIAFQTNILALNAAVEAARAGEQGRGFAVVASEVRSLAQRSAEAAKEIKALIGRSVESVEVGSRQVDQAREVMGEIVSSVRHVSSLIGEMATSASEQRDGISQVHQAVDNIDQMTQQNAALVEESSAAAASLRDQAQRLTQTVQVFKVSA